MRLKKVKSLRDWENRWIAERGMRRGEMSIQERDEMRDHVEWKELNRIKHFRYPRDRRVNWILMVFYAIIVIVDVLYLKCYVFAMIVGVLMYFTSLVDRAIK